MRTILVATAIAMVATAAQAAPWDPAHSTRDRQLWTQSMIGTGTETSSVGSKYDPASDRGARLVHMSTTMSPMATYDGTRTGAYPTYDPASDRGARFGE